jgi:hypothetical protein
MTRLDSDTPNAVDGEALPPVGSTDSPRTVTEDTISSGEPEMVERKKPSKPRAAKPKAVPVVAKAAPKVKKAKAVSKPRAAKAPAKKAVGKKIAAKKPAKAAKMAKAVKAGRKTTAKPKGGRGRAPSGIKNKLYKLMVSVLPKSYMTPDGDINFKELISASKMTPEGVYRWFRKDKVMPDKAMLLVKLCKGKLKLDSMHVFVYK